MTKRTLAACLCAAVGAAFAAGYFAAIPHRSPDRAGRKILCYIDPMHPAYKSDKPGIAPDCGMQLEPVYADGSTGTAGTQQVPGTVEMDAARQQAIGVRVVTVERGGGSHAVRLVGKVAPDERRLYVINATVDGWITGVGPQTTGSIVRKDDVLGSFYSPDFLSGVQALLFALTSLDRTGRGDLEGDGRQDQLAQFRINLRQYRDSLRNLGMGERQIDRIARTRTYEEKVDIVAPASGIVLARNVSSGLRFERGKELYRIADLSRIWILIDAFPEDAGHLTPGMKVGVTIPSAAATVSARVSAVPPAFDATSRTLKIRLEADNPGYRLRPDMLATVDVPVAVPAMVSVPADAVLDAGTRQTVYVETKPGTFEPRLVRTGRQAGSRVEILDGVAPGERVAAAATFLIDSESRMKLAAAGISSQPRRDPVCGMYVDEERTRARSLTVAAGGETVFFCSAACRDRYRAPTAPAMKQAAATGDAPLDPICAMKVDAAEARRQNRTLTVAGTEWLFCSTECRDEFRRHPDQYTHPSGTRTAR